MSCVCDKMYEDDQCLLYLFTVYVVFVKKCDYPVICDFMSCVCDKM